MGFGMIDMVRKVGLVAHRVFTPLLVAVACAASSRPAEPPGHAMSSADAGAPESGSPQAFRSDSGTEADAESAEAVAGQTLAPPEPIHAIHPEMWFDALKSNARPVDLPGRKCIRDVGGCPFKEVELPQCPEGQPVAEVKTHTEVARWVGVETVFRGSLTSQVVPAVDCEPHCCRKGLVPRVFRVSLREETGDGAEHTPWTQLWLYHPQFLLAFSCLRDDFATCCPMPPAEHALVSGTLVRSDRNVSAPMFTNAFGYAMENPRLCKQRSPL
jgi:hypothetical protein